MQSQINAYLSSATPSSPIIALPPIQRHFDVIGRELLSPPYTPPPPIIRRGGTGNYTTATAKRKTSDTTSKRIVAQWLFFNESRWIPLDLVNHEKLENAIHTKGTFMDIQDSHFPEVPRVRVFPELDYLSYLGIRYKISKVLLPT
jgi:hypothetical protein